MIGRTGVGKSTQLENVVITDIDAGKPGMFLDPHGSSALRILDSIKRTRKICYFDLSDLEYPIRYNPIAGIPTDLAWKVATDHVEAVKDIVFERDFNAPRFTYYYRHHLIPLIEKGDRTLSDLMRMLSDKDYRERVTTGIKDPRSQQFWEPKTGSFAQKDKKYNTEAVAPIENKLDQILSSPYIRNVLDCRKPTLKLKDAFDEGYYVVVNLAKGIVGEKESSFLASLLVADANNALMSRTDTECTPTALTFDEFQNYAVDVVARMLAEIRKKGGELTLAHQFISQLITKGDEQLFDALMGNCGTVISFQASPKDAALLAPQFDTRPHESFSPKALTNLEPFHAYMRTTDWSLIETQPPLPPTGRKDVVINASRERFARRV